MGLSDRGMPVPQIDYDSVAELYGNYNRAAFDPAQSLVLIWVLEK